MEHISTLLDHYLELTSMSPDIRKWNCNFFQNDEPRLARFKRIKALFLLFTIDCTYVEFPYGDFIDRREEEIRCLVRWGVKKDLSEQNWNAILTGRNRNGGALKMAFEHLFNYRKQLWELQNFNSRIYEASDMMITAICYTNQWNRDISNIISRVDEILSKFINPVNQVADIEFLTTKYGYADVDLYQIDIDNL